MPIKKPKIVVRKTSFEEEQKTKDDDFLNLTPAERLRIHEDLRKRIWGDEYHNVSIKGLIVSKKPIPE